MDVLFIIPFFNNLSNLANRFSAIDLQHGHFCCFQHRYNYSCEILDCDALRIDEDEAIKRIKESKCKLACFVLYGQQPNQGTFLMIGANSLAKKLKDNHPDIKIGFIGSHISALPMEVISYPFVDFVFINEGVYALEIY